MTGQHPKRDYLHAAGALHPHPETVQAELFQRHRFFDPLDKVQVKYEMLRAQAVDGASVSFAAAAFGFSRETFYQTLRAFEERGIVGLCDDKRGRRGPVKLSSETIAWLDQAARQHPELSGRELAQRLEQERGVSVHRRTVERLLSVGGKTR
jgi:transposase